MPQQQLVKTSIVAPNWTQVWREQNAHFADENGFATVQSKRKGYVNGIEACELLAWWEGELERLIKAQVLNPPTGASKEVQLLASAEMKMRPYCQKNDRPVWGNVPLWGSIQRVAMWMDAHNPTKLQPHAFTILKKKKKKKKPGKWADANVIAALVIIWFITRKK